MTKNTTNLKSITIKEVYGNVSNEDIGKILFTIKGIATTHFSHMSKYGENIGLKGDFAAISGKTGEIFTSQAAFLPTGITKDVITKLDNGDYEVEFSATIKCVASDKNSRGIAYIADEPVTEARLERQAKLMQWANDNLQPLLGS